MQSLVLRVTCERSFNYVMTGIMYSPESRPWMGQGGVFPYGIFAIDPSIPAFPLYRYTWSIKLGPRAKPVSNPLQRYGLTKHAPASFLDCLPRACRLEQGLTCACHMLDPEDAPSSSRNVARPVALSPSTVGPHDRLHP